jgi:hypothetical protein
MAVSTVNTGQLVRDEIWSSQVQEELQEELAAQRLVQWIQDEFPDGDLITIPTLGSLQTRNYVENDTIALDDPSVGEFQLQIDQYRQSGIAITDKMKEDTFYMSVLVQKFPEQMLRALMERLEADIYLLHKKQTSNDANSINGQDHRYVGSGTSNAITLLDVAQAKLSLDKAFVSKNGRVAVVDPTVSYQLVQIDNVIRQDVYGANSHLKEGFGGTSFIGTYLGFDFFESNMLDEATALNHVAGGSLIGNMFLGEEALIGAIRTMPDIEFYRDTNRKRDVFHAVSRYGLGLFRPESLVTVLTG